MDRISTLFSGNSTIINDSAVNGEASRGPSSPKSGPVLGL